MFVDLIDLPLDNSEYTPFLGNSQTLMMGGTGQADDYIELRAMDNSNISIGYL